MRFLTFFFPTLPFFLSGGLALIRYSLVFHMCRVLERNQFSFHQQYLCYLEYSQEGNGLLGYHLVFSDWNIGLSKLCLKNVF